MKPWKLVLGAGAACAACCAVPLFSGAAALGLGSGLFAGGIGALTAYTDSWLPLGAGGVALAAVAGIFAWQRRRPHEPAGTCGCSGTTGATACGKDGP